MSNKRKDFYEYPNNVVDKVRSPKITVRTLAYNHAPYIANCIERVLMQETSYSFEYIIADDYSTDGTREIIIEYAEKYPDIIRAIISKKNIGGTKSAYRAEKRARGEYLALCEGDDYWTDPKKLQQQVELMEQHPECHLSFHPVYVEWANSERKNKLFKRHANHNHLFPVEKIIQEGGEFCPTASLIIKRKAREILGDSFQNLPVGDYFTQIMGSMNGGALYIDKPMAVYRKGVEGSWSERYKEFIPMCNHSLGMLKANRQFDQKTNYKFHKHFKERETRVLKKYSIFKTYNYDDETVKKVKTVINKQTEGSLKMKCYLYLFYSFLYYRMNFKKIFDFKNRLKSKM